MPFCEHLPMTMNVKNNWYAIRVPYGREMKLKNRLDCEGIKSFIPMQHKQVIQSGKTEIRLVPAIRNLIFIYASRPCLNTLKLQVENCTPFRYIIDRITNNPIIVPEQDMNQFIAVAGTLNEQLIYLTNIEPVLRNGDQVLVTGGIFEGVQGRIVRIKKDRRVLVSIHNLIAIATAHINPLLLQKIEKQ